MDEPVGLAQMVQAIKAADVAGVERALASGVDPKAVVYDDGEHLPLIVLAAQVGEWNGVRVLLDAGAEPRAFAWREGVSPIGNDDITESLGNAIERGIMYDRYEVVELLLQRGMKVDFSLVGAALHRPRLLRLLLERGANPNGQHVGDCIMNGSQDVGNLEALRLLLEYGADPNSKVRNSTQRAVVSAIEYGRLEEARALLAAGATMPTLAEAEEAVRDAGRHWQEAMGPRALATAQALGFPVTRR